MMTTTINMMMINNQNLNIYEDDQIDNANDLGLSPEGPWHAALCQGTAENETNFQNCHQDRDYGGNGQMKLGHFMEFKVEKESEHKVTKDRKDVTEQDTDNDLLVESIAAAKSGESFEFAIFGTGKKSESFESTGEFCETFESFELGKRCFTSSM